MSAGERIVAALGVIACLSTLLACSNDDGASPGIVTGRPDGGPYRMEAELRPPRARPSQSTEIITRVTRRSDGRALQGLQVLHERVVHNFLVNLDFSSFAHIHHEDFAALTADDLAQATFRFPYTFPVSGHYRLVSQFTYRDRSWTKHFDFAIGDAPPPHVAVDLAREQGVGAYTARLSSSPAQPVAGFETELVLELSRDGVPVTDLELLLGSEVHVALWRSDGSSFGHTHSWTPHMAAMVSAMHDRERDAQARAAAMTGMMVAMMNMPAKLVFPGPRVPVHYVFPDAGTWVLFFHCAPGGVAQVFRFMLEVVPYASGTDTRLESILGATAHGAH